MTVEHPADINAIIREMRRETHQALTRDPFISGSITRGSGVRLALPAGIWLDGDGTIEAGGLVFSAAGDGTIQAGGAYIKGAGGGQVGAGGTNIGGDGRISNTSGINRFNGNVAADGGVSGASASFPGALGAGSAYITGSTNVGGLYSRGDMATEGIITERGRDLGYDTDAARLVANDAWGRSNSAQATGDYGVSEALAARAVANQAYAWGYAAATQNALNAVEAYATAIRNYASSIEFWFNKHMDDHHGGGGKSPGNPPVMG